MLFTVKLAVFNLIISIGDLKEGQNITKFTGDDQLGMPNKEGYTHLSSTSKIGFWFLTAFASDRLEMKGM